MHAQQSSRVPFSQISPSGLQPVGLRQRPIGGDTALSSTQVTLPSPGSPEPLAPQQSLLTLQASPTTRQPEATWQACPPNAVMAQLLLQHMVLSEQPSPSTLQLPAPVETITWHSPTLPAVPEQIPVQQSAPR
jgi:hypothetical protein